MDTRTGEIIGEAEVKKLPASEQRHFIPVIRDLRKKEIAEHQILLYRKRKEIQILLLQKGS